MEMINTKIRTHKNLYGVAEKFYGFTARQWFFLILAFVICVPGYLYLKTVIGDELSSWLVIIVGGPIILMGFVDIQGLPLGRLFPFLIRHYLKFGKPLSYKTQKQLDQEAWEKSKEGRKAARVKKAEQKKQEKQDKKQRKDKPTRRDRKDIKKAQKKAVRDEKERIRMEELDRQQTRELALAMRKYGLDAADVKLDVPIHGLRREDAAAVIHGLSKRDECSAEYLTEEGGMKHVEETQ